MLLMTLLAMHGCTEIKQSKGKGILGEWGGECGGGKKKNKKNNPHWILKIFLWFPAGLLECYYGRSSLWEGLHTQEFLLKNSSNSWKKAIGWINPPTAPTTCEWRGVTLSPLPTPPSLCGHRLPGPWPGPALGSWGVTFLPHSLGGNLVCRSGISSLGQALILLSDHMHTWGEGSTNPSSHPQSKVAVSHPPCPTPQGRCLWSYGHSPFCIPENDIVIFSSFLISSAPVIPQASLSGEGCAYPCLEGNCSHPLSTGLPPCCSWHGGWGAGLCGSPRP